MQTVGEVQQDPQVLANGYLQRRRQPDGTTLGLAANPAQFDEQPVDIPAALAKGEHTDQVLSELGFTADELAGLRSRAVI